MVNHLMFESRTSFTAEKTNTTLNLKRGIYFESLQSKGIKSLDLKPSEEFGDRNRRCSEEVCSE